MSQPTALNYHQYAAGPGGGTNHRGLYDTILIKANHVAATVDDSAAVGWPRTPPSSR